VRRSGEMATELTKMGITIIGSALGKKGIKKRGE